MSGLDVLVVGAGPAGLSAAVELRRLGASVMVAEREQQAGGIPRHTDHLGFGMRDLHRMMAGPRYAATLVERADRAGADIRVGTTVLDIEGTLATLHTATGVEPVEATAIVLATGVRERPRSARLVPGDRPAGVLTTGSLQQCAMRRQPVGRTAVVIGAEHVSFSAVITLRHLGCVVAAMVTPYERHQTLAPLRWAAAARYRVPVRSGVEVTNIIGGRRVEAVELSDGSTIRCDTVVFTGDWIPDHELARRTGVSIDPGSQGPITDARFRTAVRGVFAIGNLIHPAETADVCSLDGRSVGGSIVDWLEHDSWPESAQPIAVAAPIRWAAHTSRGIVVRVSEFASGDVIVKSADGQMLTRSRRRLVPNQSILVADRCSPAALLTIDTRA